MGEKRNASVVVADDHPLTREMIHKLLDRTEHITLVGETDNGLDTVHMVEELNPDILILDIQLPVMNGIEVIRMLKQEGIHCAILIFSVIKDPVFEEETLCSGACHYIVKDEPTALIEALDLAIQGECQQTEPCDPPIGGVAAYEVKMPGN